MYVSLGHKRIRQAVAQKSKRTYQSYFRYWKLFRMSAGLPVFLLARAGGDSYVRLLVAWIRTVSPPPVDSKRAKRGHSFPRRGRDQVACT